VNDLLKQRLVGALILVALGVLFWPIIFVEPDSPSTADQSHFLDPPEVNTTPLAPPDSSGLRRPPQFSARQQDQQEDMDPKGSDLSDLQPEVIGAESAKEESDSKDGTIHTQSTGIAKVDRKTRTEAPAKPELDAQGVPIAWILQVVSVASPQTAEKLRLKLLDMGHKAYVKKISTSEQALYRVYIGPKFEKVKLEDAMAKIDAEFAVKSIIRRYIP
jgi:DedD protein